MSGKLGRNEIKDKKKQQEIIWWNIKNYTVINYKNEQTRREYNISREYDEK